MSTMKAVQFETGSGPENMSVGDVARPTLRTGEILIRVHSSAINRADTLQRKGLYPPPKGDSDILGLEAAGEIVEVQESCGRNWNIGDRVMALLAGGGNAEYVAVDACHVMPIPKSITMLEAGGLPEVWLTAYQLLYLVGKLQANDSVLIHAGASGVGTAAIQLVKEAGATAYITAGSSPKIKFAKSLGAAEGFNYKEGDWAEKLMEVTKGNGVNMVLDCIGGSYWQQNAAVLSMDGRWVLYGLMGGATVEGPFLRQLLSKRISVLSSALRARDKQYKARLIESFEKHILPKFDSMRFKPVVESSFSLKDIAKAHTLMESNGNIGKILIRVYSRDGIEEL
ncbi:quinone oxidoreductase PIG3-like isoform X2 [Watersipora subatra]